MYLVSHFILGSKKLGFIAGYVPHTCTHGADDVTHDLFVIRHEC